MIGSLSVARLWAAVALMAISLGAVVGVREVAAQPLRVDPSAHEIRAYRLSAATVARLEQVMLAMDRLPPPPPEGARSDVAMFVILSMAFAYHQPWTDRTVAETVRLVDGGHPALAAAIRGAGLSTRDYVLGQMTLLLTYPVIAQQKRGPPRAAPTDVAPENLAFVERYWVDVDRLMTAFLQRVAAARP